MNSNKNTKLKFLLIGLVALGSARQDLLQIKNPPIILPDRQHSERVFESKNYHSQIKAGNRDNREKNFEYQYNRRQFVPLPPHIIKEQKHLPINVYQKQRYEHQSPQRHQKQVEKKYFYPQPTHYQEPVYQRPIYQQPVYQRPIQQESEHQRPVYQEPEHHRPVYKQVVIERPVYKVLPPPTFNQYSYFAKGQHYKQREGNSKGKSFIHQVKKAQRQFDPKNILKKEQREKEQEQEQQKQNQQRNWDEEKKKYYLEHYYKLHQHDNYEDRSQFWRGFDDDFDAYKRGTHKQQANWHQYKHENHDDDSKHDREQYHERRQPQSSHKHEDHDQAKGVHPNPLLPQPYPEVECKSKNCQKSHNLRDGKGGYY